MLRKTLALLLAAGIASLSTACSLAAPRTQSIVIIPSHPSAEVYVDGIPRGRGTTTVQLDRNGEYTVLATCGSVSGGASIDRHFSETGLLDIVGGILILVPFIGVLTSGAYELSPTTVNVAIPDTSGCDAFRAPRA